MSRFKDWDDLTIADDFLFCRVMRNEQICRQLLELILHVKVGKIKFLTSQHEIEIDPQSKAIAMDVYLRDEDKVVNVEMQNGHRLELPKRTRYYQAVADVDNTSPGKSYTDMKDNYVIFICTFDPFLLGNAIYEFENICMSCKPPLPLNDGTHKIFLNTTADDLTLLDPDLKLFYDYVRCGTAESQLTERINGEITAIKKNREARRKYMTYTTRIMEAKTDALNEGIAIGEKRGEERGRNEGISLGEKKAKLETAKKFLAMGLSVEQVADGTGLSIEEIEKL